MRRRIIGIAITLYLILSYSLGLIYITDTALFGVHNDYRLSKREVAATWIMSPFIVPYALGEHIYYRYFGVRDVWHRND